MIALMDTIDFTKILPPPLRRCLLFGGAINFIALLQIWKNLNDTVGWRKKKTIIPPAISIKFEWATKNPSPPTRLSKRKHNVQLKTNERGKNIAV